MNLVKDIGDYLQTNAYGTVGTNIFLGTMPASPDECIAIFLQEDTAVDRIAGIDAPIERVPGIRKPRFQVLTRAATYNAGIALMQSVEDELTQVGDEYIGTVSEGAEINGSFYFRMNTTEDAFVKEEDVSGRFVFAQNFNTAIKI